MDGEKEKTPKSLLNEYHQRLVRGGSSSLRLKFNVVPSERGGFQCSLTYYSRDLQQQQVMGYGRKQKQAEQDASQKALADLKLNEDKFVVQPAVVQMTSSRLLYGGSSHNEDVKESQLLLPRDYQYEIFKQTQEKNSLVFMDTGSGKTLIAVMAIKDIMLRREFKEKLAVFFAPTCELAEQQFKVCRQQLAHLKVVKLTGDNGSSCNGQKWLEIKRCCNLMVMTPQILVQCLVHGFLAISDFAIFVFDEIHNARGDSPYSELLKFYANAAEQVRPRILGLTASPVGSKNNIEKSVQELVELTNCQCVQIPDNAMRYGTKAEAYEQPYDSMDVDEHVIRLFEVGVKEIRMLENQLLNKQVENRQVDYEGVWYEEKKTQKCIEVVKKKLNIVQHCLTQFGPVGALVSCHVVLGAKDFLSKDLSSLQQSLPMESIDLPRLLESSLKKVYLSMVSGVIAALAAWEGVKTECWIEDEEPKLLIVKQKLMWYIEQQMDKYGLDSKNQRQWEMSQDTYQEELSKISNNGRQQGGCNVLQFQDGLCSPKYELLVKILDVVTSEENDLSNWRCLVFVEQRCSALVLKRMLDMDGRLENLRVGYMLSIKKKLFKSSKDSLKKFRDGEYNVLVCTSVAEEGLDVQLCKLVIRFDLPPTVKAYVQSKGRARAEEASYVFMTEKGNRQHISLLQKLNSGENTLQQVKYTAFADTAGQQEKSDCEEEDTSEEDEEEEEYLEIESTGARLPQSQALQLLNYYCSTLPHDQYTSVAPRITYKETKQEMDSCKNLRKYSITMPVVCPFKTAVVGPAHESFKLAKRKAALLMCKKLHSVKELDDNLEPAHVSRKQALENWLQLDFIFGDESEEDGNKREYGIKSYAGQVQLQPKRVADCLVGPEICIDRGVQPLLNLYLYTICCGSSFGHIWGVMSVQKLPNLDEQNSLYSYISCLQVNFQELDALLSQHLMLVDVMQFHGHKWSNGNFNVFFDNNVNHLRVLTGTRDQMEGDGNEFERVSGWYLLVPLVRQYSSDSWKFDGVQINQQLIPREAILFQEYMRHCSASTLKDLNSRVNKQNIYVDCVVHHTRNGLVQQYRARSDKHMSEFIPHKVDEHGNGVTYWQHFEDKYPLEVKSYTIDDEMVKVYHGRPQSKRNLGQESHTYHLPALLRVHPLHKDIWVPCYELASTLWELDNLLVLYDGWRELDRVTNAQYTSFLKLPSLSLVRQAFTAKRASNLINYERLETLGDSVLKFLATAQLYWDYQYAHEGSLSVLRDEVVSNKNLYKLFYGSTLAQYIRLFQAQDIEWGPPGNQYLRSQKFKQALQFRSTKDEQIQKGSQEESQQIKVLTQGVKQFCIVSRKVPADIVEALIGVYYLENGLSGAWQFIQRLGLMDVIIGEEMYREEDFCLERGLIVQDNWNGNIERIEDVLEYKFIDKANLCHALTHPSFQEGQNYQRLEFLGDAVLDYVVMKRMFDDYPSFSPGELTALKQRYVNNVYLGSRCVQLELYQYIRHMSVSMEADIRKFVQQMKSGNVESDGIDAPKVLGDVMESLIGAIYVDTSGNFKIIQEVLDKLLLFRNE